MTQLSEFVAIVVQRGSLTLWFTEDGVEQWYPEDVAAGEAGNAPTRAWGFSAFWSSSRSCICRCAHERAGGVAPAANGTGPGRRAKARCAEGNGARGGHLWLAAPGRRPPRGGGSDRP